MILAIDVGNTNIVLGCIDEGRIINSIRIRTEKNATFTEYAMQLKGILSFEGIETSALSGAIISSVVPQLTAVISEAIQRVAGIDCVVVGSGMKTGMNIRIDDPGTLAGDIVVGGVAALEYYGVPVIVLDMGTATTLVVIDGNKNYLGGAIMPGVNLSYSALSSGASLLPYISISAPKKCIATNTIDSMRSGAVFGTAAMLDGMIDRMERELGEKCKIVATGGIASDVIPYCSHEIIYDDELLLKGLWYLYNKNR